MSTTTTTMGLVKPDVNDQVSQTIADLAENFEKIDKAFSFVGMIIESAVLIDPNDYYGGTWTQLSGRMLVGAGTDFPAGTTGGEKTHILTVSEMPAHTHATGGNDVVTYKASGDPAGYIATSTSGYPVGSPSSVESTGGGGAHTNMPPYKSVYMWERTA